MPITLAGGCRVSEMREGECLSKGTLSIWDRISRATGARAISLRIMEFAPGLSPEIRNGASDEILYVLGTWERGRPVRQSDDNERVVAQAFINGQACDISPDTGIYVRPHETFAIDNPGPDSIVLVSCRCPEPEGEPEFVTESKTSSVRSSKSWERGRPVRTAPKVRSTPVALVRLAGRRAQPTADRWYRVLIDDEVGSLQATQFVGSIPPGRAPDHFHNYEEVLFILKGEGRMWTGETNTPIAPGSCIYLPKGQVHCVENTGEGELRLLGVFYPAGSPGVRYEI